MYLSIVSGIFSAFFNALTIFQTKQLTKKYRSRSLVGPLFVANLIIVLPLTIFESWIFTPKIILLHFFGAFIGAIATLMALDLYDFGQAPAIATAEA